jgi:hypothetical protein
MIQVKFSKSAQLIRAAIHQLGQPPPPEMTIATEQTDRLLNTA